MEYSYKTFVRNFEKFSAFRKNSKGKKGTVQIYEERTKEKE